MTMPCAHFFVLPDAQEAMENVPEYVDVPCSHCGEVRRMKMKWTQEDEARLQSDRMSGEHRHIGHWGREKKG